MEMPDFGTDPTILVGAVEFVVSLIFFRFLLRIFQRSFRLLKLPGLGGDKICDISVMTVSSIFAIIGCILSISVLFRAEKRSVIFDRLPVIRHFMIFAAAYFTYDTLAMYERFSMTQKAVGLKGTLSGFFVDRPMIIFHHIVIPVVIFSTVLRVKLGDYLFAVAILMEASTPFVSLRRILEVLEMKQSLFYIINGITMTVVFFWCRIANLFYIYYMYAKELDLSVTETALTKVPIFCSCCTLLIISPQIWWWSLMVKGCFKHVFSNQKKQS